VWVRTRAGDLLINGPHILGSSLLEEKQPIVDDELGQSHRDSIESFGGDPIKEGGKKFNPNRAHQRSGKQSKGGKKQKNQNRNIPNLPYNMLRKLPRALPSKRKGANRKEAGLEEGSRTGEELEVVLPVVMADVEEINPILEPVFQTEVVVGNGNTVHPNAISVPREMHEAENLVNIGVELGINFQGNDGEDVAKVVAMEERDRLEKEEWESKRDDCWITQYKGVGESCQKEEG
jgi:hypothetical protein